MPAHDLYWRDCPQICATAAVVTVTQQCQRRDRQPGEVVTPAALHQMTQTSRQGTMMNADKRYIHMILYIIGADPTIASGGNSDTFVPYQLRFDLQRVPAAVLLPTW